MSLTTRLPHSAISKLLLFARLSVSAHFLRIYNVERWWLLNTSERIATLARLSIIYFIIIPALALIIVFIQNLTLLFSDRPRLNYYAQFWRCHFYNSLDDVTLSLDNYCRIIIASFFNGNAISKCLHWSFMVLSVWFQCSTQTRIL